VRSTALDFSVFPETGLKSMSSAELVLKKRSILYTATRNSLSAGAGQLDLMSALVKFTWYFLTSPAYCEQRQTATVYFLQDEKFLLIQVDVHGMNLHTSAEGRFEPHPYIAFRM